MSQHQEAEVSCCLFFKHIYSWAKDNIVKSIKFFSLSDS